MARREPDFMRVKRVHPHAWLWEPLESDAEFVLGSMFGTNVVYLGGRLMLCFAAKDEPWRGVLVCTERQHHAALIAAFPQLHPHPVLGKWLYLPESADAFETVAVRLVHLAGRRDPRIGIVGAEKKSRAR